MNIEKLKESLGALESTLLAIDELSHVCQQSICSGTSEIDLEHCANLLHYLIEPALMQAEALRNEFPLRQSQSKLRSEFSVSRPAGQSSNRCE